MQKAAGVDVFTDGEYRRGNFMADFTNTLVGMVSESRTGERFSPLGPQWWSVRNCGERRPASSERKRRF